MPIYDFVDIYKRLFRNIKRKGGFARLPDDDYFKLSLPEVLERLERSDDRSSWTTNRMWVGYEEGSKKWAEPLELVQQCCFERERLCKTKAWGAPLQRFLQLFLSSSREKTKLRDFPGPSSELSRNLPPTAPRRCCQ